MNNRSDASHCLHMLSRLLSSCCQNIPKNYQEYPGVQTLLAFLPPDLIYLLSHFFKTSVRCLRFQWLFFLAPDPTCRILVPWVGLEPEPLQWKHWVLTTRLPGKSPSDLMRCMEVIKQHSKTICYISAKQFASSWDIRKCPCGDCGGVGILRSGRFFQQCSNTTLSTSNVFKDRFFLLSCPQSSGE